MTIATTTQQDQGPEVADLGTLRSRLDGRLITPDVEGYEERRKVQDITVDRRPSVIVQPANAADVAEAVRFARSTGLPLAVRSGGHSLAGFGTVDGGVMIDLSTMKSVTVDPERKTARVGAGATSADLAGPAHAYGLALSTGDTASVGLGGLTTGGGIGWMARKYGLTIDNLLSAQVVTADGEVVTASPDEHQDLFWAIRGGGGNFGVITEFEYRLAPVGQVLGGALLLPATFDVIRGYLDYAPDAPDGLTCISSIIQAPPAPFVPEERVGEVVLMILAVWAGDTEEGERAIAPLRALAEPVADTISPIPYPVIYEYTQEATAPFGVALRSMFAKEISDADIETILHAMDGAPGPVSFVELRGLGGAMNRIDADATAFAHRDKRYMVSIIDLWDDPAEDPAPHHAWVGSLWGQIKHAASGVYVNFVGEEGEGRIRDAYPPATHQRLAEVKRTYDPTNLFRLNQNVSPEA